MLANIAAYTLAFVNASSLFSRLLSNLVDKVGSLRIHIPFSFVSALLAFFWIAEGDQSSLVALSTLRGFFSEKCVSLAGPIAVPILENSPEPIGT